MRAVRCMCRNAQVAIFRSCGLALEAFALALEHTQQAPDSSYMVIIEHHLYSESLGVSGALWGLWGQVAVPAEVKTQVMKHAALLDVDLLCLLDLLAPDASAKRGQYGSPSASSFDTGR